MLPEQVWDHQDLPERGMYEGRSAGSAQPLVWAHAEYIKLLRSVVDGRIFDTISVVAERYAVQPGTRTFRNTVEIFQVGRPISQVPTGLYAAGHRRGSASTSSIRSTWLEDDANADRARLRLPGLLRRICPRRANFRRRQPASQLYAPVARDRRKGRNIGWGTMSKST